MRYLNNNFRGKQKRGLTSFRLTRTGTETSFYRIGAVFLFLMLILSSSTPQAGSVKGRIYISDYYSSDSGNYDFHVLTSKIRLYKLEEEKPGFYFNINGRARTKLTGDDLHADIPEFRLNELWVGYKFPDRKLNIKAGRQYIDEMYNSYIDGINVKYSFKKGMGIGVFGGLAPDRYDNSFNTRFQSTGIYGFMERDKHNISLGYENLRFEGKTDREYLSAKAHIDISKKVRFNATSSVSIDQPEKEFNIENLSLNLLFAQSESLRVNLFYNYYRAVKYFESAKHLLNLADPDSDYYLRDNPQSRAGIRFDYRILKDLDVYMSAAYQKRDLDDKRAARITGGLRKRNLAGFDISGEYTYINNFDSKDSEFTAELSRNLTDNLELSLRAGYEVESPLLEKGASTGISTYGASLFWTINRNYHLLMMLERYGGDDYHNTSLFTQIGYKF